LVLGAIAAIIVAAVVLIVFFAIAGFIIQLLAPVIAGIIILIIIVVGGGWLYAKYRSRQLEIFYYFGRPHLGIELISNEYMHRMLFLPRRQNKLLAELLSSFFHMT
jgi:hypothetical protein